MLHLAIEDIDIFIDNKTYFYNISVEIKNMVISYYNDGVYFIKKDDYVNALASFSYAYGWLDCGIRLGLYIFTDESLFSI